MGDHKRNRGKLIQFRVTDEVKNLVQQLAEREGRSIANYLEREIICAARKIELKPRTSSDTVR